MKKICLVVILIILSLLSTTRVKGQIVINEVFSNPAGTAELDEFIELYNLGTETVNLSGWKISDTNGTIKTYTITETSIMPLAYLSFRRFVTGITLNNDKDGVELINDTGSKVDSVVFGAVLEGFSVSRLPNGLGELVINTELSEQAENIPLPAPESTPTPTPVATSTSSPYKTVYKINKPKDGGGLELKSVQIYVDGNYVHHEDDEILEFFNGHECYSAVSCGLGVHTISLRKSGYLSWEDTQNFTAGANMEVNPVLHKEEASTPTPAPTKTPTPKPTPTKTPIPTILKITNASESASTVSGVLGLKVDNPEPDSTTPMPEGAKGKPPILPAVLILGGLCFIAIPISSIIKNGKKDLEAS